MSDVLPPKQQDDRDVEALIVALSHEDSDTRAAAAESLGEHSDRQAVEALIITALNDFHWRVRCNAAEALGKIGDVRAVEPLIASLKHLDANTQAAAAKALGYLGDQRAVEALTARLRRGSVAVSTVSAEALEKLGGSAIVMAERAARAKRNQGARIMRGGGFLFAIAIIVNRSFLDITIVAYPISSFLLLLGILVCAVGLLRWWWFKHSSSHSR